MASASPFALDKKSKGGSPFDLKDSGKSTSPFALEDSKADSPFDTGSGLTPAQERNSLPALEKAAEASGAPDPSQDSPGLFSRVLDLISRPNYAVAGAAQEAFTNQGGGLGAVPGRIANELLSGIGSFKGKKEGFGQVLEEAGVPEYGHFSDLAPFLYNDTGEGLALQKGGWADPTGRGAVGLGLDIAADPTTYLGFGIGGKTAKVGDKFLSKSGQRLLESETAKVAEELGKTGVAEEMFAAGLKNFGEGPQAAFVRDLAKAKGKERVAAAIDAGAIDLLDPGGIKWMGMHVADNPLNAIANSGVSKDLVARLAPTAAGKAALASTEWMKSHITDPVLSMFVKGWGIRGLKGAQPIIDDALNKKAFWQGEMHADVAASPFAKWAKLSSKKRADIFRPVIDAYQAGGLAAVPEEFRDAMTYYAKSVGRMYGEEVKAGLLQREQKLANYFAHYYDNEVEDLERVVYAARGGVSAQGVVENLLRMGRNAEERVYDTLKDAVETSTRLNRADKSIPILKPIYDPVESLTRRWEHSITKRINREMVSDLSEKFGQLPFNVNNVYDLSKPVGKVAASDVKTFSAIQAGTVKNKVAAVSGMTDAGKRAYFVERFRNIGDREEAANVLKAYDDLREFFPKVVKADMDFAADGSVFKEFNAGGNYSATLPKTLADEVAGLSDHLLKNKNLRKLLQGYDTVNNFWKGSVTWLFPAFHVRNAYSNVAQSFVDIGISSLNPAQYQETASILFGKGPGIFKTSLGNYTYDEVRTILNRHGINTSAAAIAEFTGNESKILKPFKKFREAGTAIENESRAQLALNYLRRGMDDAEVGARVKKFQLDYSNGLTNFERQWMKRIIPFYSFQRLNLGLQLDNILHRPGMVAAQLKPFRGRADENAQMTSWDAGALKLRLNRDGKTVQMITGIDLPIRNLDLLFRGNLKDTFANAVGMLTPILKVPIEVAANKSLFTGNEFNRANAPAAGRIVEQMPVSMQKWMGYKKEFDKAGRPKYTLDAQRYYLIGQSYATSRILSTADRQWRQYIDNANGTALQSLLDLATGLRFTDMNLDEEEKKKAAERTRDLEQALVRWGTRKEHRNTYVPKAGQK